jgi:hypothetical protein
MMGRLEEHIKGLKLRQISLRKEEKNMPDIGFKGKQ